MTKKKEDVVARRIAELEAIDGVQARTDRVAEDLSSGKHRFAVIGARALGELLGVHFEDSGSGDWHHIEYGYKGDLDDSGDEFPFARQGGSHPQGGIRDRTPLGLWAHACHQAHRLLE